MALGIVVLIVLGGIIAFFTLRVKKAVTPHWQSYTAPDNRLVADFPGYPVEESPETTATAEKKADQLPWHAYVADLGAQGAVIVRYYDLSPLIAKVGSITPPQREKVMIQIEKDMASEVHGGMKFNLAEKHWIEVQGGEGVAASGTFDLDGKSGHQTGQMSLQTFWGAPDRIYTVIVAGPAGSEIYESRERVFQSVHIQ